MQISDVNTTVIGNAHLTMVHVWIMLAVDVVWLAMLTWYIEGVYPGDDSAPLKPWFPLQVFFSLF